MTTAQILTSITRYDRKSQKFNNMYPLYVAVLYAIAGALWTAVLHTLWVY